VAPPPAPQRSYLAPIAATSATGVVAIVGIASYLVASGHASTANDLAKGFYRPAYDSEASSADSWKHVAWVTGGVAAAGAVVSAYLWWHATRAPRIEVSATSVSFSAAW
jgi:hypothetical protein